MIGYVSTREFLKHFGTIGFKASVVAHPERRRGCQRQYVWQKIPRCVHDMNRALGVGDANMYVQPKDQERSRYHLNLFDEQFISLVLRNLLVLPMRNRMG